MNRPGHALALSFYSLFSISLLAGCLDAPRTADAPTAPAETAPEVSEVGMVRFHDGLKEVVTPYHLSEGQVIIEGDIRLGPASILTPAAPDAAGAPLGKKAANIEATAKFGQAKHWTEGYVPYAFSGNVTGSDLSTIKSAVREWNRVSPVPFIPRNGEAAYVLFIMTNETASSSDVGRVGAGSQMLKVVSGENVRSVRHEMGHASGLWHEQSRSDRAANVSVTATDNNLLTTSENWKFVGENHGPYDPTSLMHYTPATLHYVKNGAGKWVFDPTGASPSSVTLANLPGHPAINSGNNLSEGDIKGLAALYFQDLAWRKVTASKSVTSKVTTHLRTFRTGSKFFALEYDKASGEYRIYESLPANGDIILRHSGNLGKNMDVVEAFRMGSTTFLYHCNATTGAARILKMNESGSVGTTVQTTTWTPGQTVVRVVESGGNFYMIRMVPKQGGAIFPINADGSVTGMTQDFEAPAKDDLITFSTVPSKWTLTPGNVVSFTTSFVIFYEKASGLAKVQEITKDGILLSTFNFVTMTGADELHPYIANKRPMLLVRSTATGTHYLHDFRPEFSGNVASPPLSGLNVPVIRYQAGAGGYFMRPLTYSPLGAGEGAKMWVYKKADHNLHNWDIFPFIGIQ